VVASHDKESFLDSWRRLRLIVEDGFVLPSLPDIVDVQRIGHQLVLTTKNFAAGLEDQLRQSGATINDVERLTLEEIFITSVTSRDALQQSGEAA
jgi:ABC-2 type transport system ATP-binding protein